MNKNLPHKVAVVVPKYGLVGGAEGYVAETTSRLVSDDREIHVFANKWLKDEQLAFHKVPILSFPRFLISISFAYYAGKQMHREAVRKPFDLIHTHDRIFDADLFTMHSIPHRIWVKEVRKKRTSLFDHATAWVERFLVEKGRCLYTAVSSLSKEKFLQEYPQVDPTRVYVVHPGIDPFVYRDLDKEACRAEIRKTYNIAKSDFVVLFVSMNFNIKGLDFLLKGLARFQSQNPGGNWKLLIAGKDDDPRFSRLAHKLGIRDRIVFAGVIERNVLRKFYLASDIFAMPSRFDTFGLTVLEAMAAGLPAIVSRNVGARDVIKQGGNGFVIQDMESPEEIAEALRASLDENTRLTTSEEAVKTAAHYSWDSTAKTTAALYESIFTAKRGACFSAAKHHF